MYKLWPREYVLTALLCYINGRTRVRTKSYAIYKRNKWQRWGEQWFKTRERARAPHTHTICYTILQEREHECTVCPPVVSHQTTWLYTISTIFDEYTQLTNVDLQSACRRERIAHTPNLRTESTWC